MCRSSLNQALLLVTVTSCRKVPLPSAISSRWVVDCNCIALVPCTEELHRPAGAGVPHIRSLHFLSSTAMLGQSLLRRLLDEAPDQERVDALVLLLQLLLLGLALIIGRVLQRYEVKWIGSAGSALVLGVLAGLLSRAVGLGSEYLDKIAFSGDIFFFIMLPTIMFDAGYQMDARPFFNNIGAICAYAFVGTTVSTFVIGLAMWAGGIWGLCYSMSLLKNLVFGAIVSATDPVTVLAVFQQLNAQEDLYANVFGESVLNDAVAMVLYNTISAFLAPNVVINAASIFKGIGLFVGIFLASTLCGLAVGFLAALVFRTQYFNSEGSTVETGLVITFAFLSYMLADVFGLSGIVSILFCSMMMSSYVKPNLSHTAEQRVHSLFAVLGGLFELFVFVYIGTSLFAERQAWHTWSYTMWCLLALAVSRFTNIYPCSLAVNFFRPVELRISAKAQFMMWWSGLRGAMAFALAVKAAQAYGEDGEVMMTVTFFLILITVIINGGACAYLLDRLKLRGGETLDTKDFQMVSLDADDDNFSPGPSSHGNTVSGTSASDSLPKSLPRPRSMRPMESLRALNNRRLHQSLSRLDQRVFSRMLIHPSQRGSPHAATSNGSPSVLRTTAFDVESNDGEDQSQLLHHTAPRS